MSWGGYEGTGSAESRGNGLPRCCGIEPTLRVRPHIVFTTLIAYVQYECRKCGMVGGLAITEPEAIGLWRERVGS